jgi:hypothetical protein
MQIHNRRTRRASFWVDQTNNHRLVAVVKYLDVFRDDGHDNILR